MIDNIKILVVRPGRAATAVSAALCKYRNGGNPPFSKPQYAVTAALVYDTFTIMPCIFMTSRRS
jgi:hypothetical protein